MKLFSYLVEEYFSKMLPVGEDLRLSGKVGSSRVYQINAGQPIFLSNLLCSQVFCDSDRIVGTTLDSGIIGHYHALNSLDSANASDDEAMEESDSTKLRGWDRSLGQMATETA